MSTVPGWLAELEPPGASLLSPPEGGTAACQSPPREPGITGPLFFLSVVLALLPSCYSSFKNDSFPFIPNG